jgi:UDP-N-acetylmuramate: L-alanyl-gamma-D-glutamyl-meso-diaminopimelate ligase
MRLHILGICGTFMGGVAALARELGHAVEGSDANVYPPMSTQLEALGIRLMEGYAAGHLQPAPDLVVVGNAMTRGNPAIEYMLDEQLRYVSGPQWLGETLLPGREVLAVAGTHGKTTTTTMVAWILEQAGLAPGFLIGGVPKGFAASARLGGGSFFVVEADEYDSAFFDKRSKFIHYAPQTAILNNLEFDHADIFENLDAIKKQFHHLVRTIPGKGRIIVPADDANLADVLAKGAWTPVEKFSVDAVLPGADWRAQTLSADGSAFAVFRGEKLGEVHWTMSGRHSVSNGIAAIMAAEHAGVAPADACRALSTFPGVKRRMEIVGEVGGITVYDDFAHHPTAIATTLEGLRRKVGTA